MYLSQATNPIVTKNGINISTTNLVALTLTVLPAMAEFAIKSLLRQLYFKMPTVFLGVARAGNVIGGVIGHMIEVVPDAVVVLEQRKVLGEKLLTRPWQHVLEPISGYSELASMLSSRADLNGEAFNFGPTAEQNRTVADLFEPNESFLAGSGLIDISKKSHI